MKKFILALATLGVGYIPFAPGTFGTLVGVLVYLPFSFFPPPLYILSVCAAFFLACWAAGWGESYFGQKDSPRIVIDEVVGYLIAVALLPRNLTVLVGGFLFFRLLDIIKPPPAGVIERRMRGGLAVVLDDAVAGVYANFLLQAIAYWRPHLLSIVDRWFFG